MPQASLQKKIIKDFSGLILRRCSEATCLTRSRSARHNDLMSNIVDCRRHIDDSCKTAVYLQM